MRDKVSSLLSLTSVCNSPFKAACLSREKLCKNKRRLLKKKKSLRLSGKRHGAIWDNTAFVEINAPHNKRSTSKCGRGSIRFGTRLGSTVGLCEGTGRLTGSVTMWWNILSYVGTFVTHWPTDWLIPTVACCKKYNEDSSCESNATDRMEQNKAHCPKKPPKKQYEICTIFQFGTEHRLWFSEGRLESFHRDA